jgi:hypothetical protein
LHQLQRKAQFDPTTGTYLLRGPKGRRGRKAAVAQQNLMANSIIGDDGKMKFAASDSPQLGAHKK